MIIGYICTEYEGEIKPDGDEVVEAKFYNLVEIPESTQPYLKEKLKQLGPKLAQLLRVSQ
ncbi:hypothetical protein D3C78_1927810 [compost metagenome]